MAHHRLPAFLLWGLILSVMSGCAYPIAGEWRKQAEKDLTFFTVIQNPDVYVGHIVIWGGLIIKTFNRPEGTEILVLESPLESNEFPDTGITYGQFIAKSSTFLDPVIYQRGRMVTLAGEIIGKRVEHLGVMKYIYPVIQIKQLYFWEKERAWWEPPSYYGWQWDFYFPYYDPYYDDPYYPEYMDIWNE